MIVIDYNQVAIGAFMAEVRNRPEADVNLPLLRHMILNTIRAYNKKHRKEFGDLVIACDNRHYWRRKVYPNYKAGEAGSGAGSRSKHCQGHDGESAVGAHGVGWLGGGISAR